MGHSSADPYFIAEAGVNHDGEIDMAIELINVAAKAEADAVKFQTFSPDRLVRPDAEKAKYQTETTGEGSQYEMLKQYELDKSAQKRLMSHCEQRDITFLSTPYDAESADMLADLEPAAIKISSGDLDNHPFLEHVAAFGLPMIVSTGMGTLEEVKAARDVIRSAGSKTDLVFLHCTSAYPCSMDDVNLRAMETMASELDESVGYSDHTIRPETPALAVASGATLVEKHFTLDSTLPGPDHEASLEPDELSRAVELVRTAARARGQSEKEPVEAERENMQVARKSIHAAQDLPESIPIEEHHLQVLRPADGLSPRHWSQVLRATTARELSKGTPITDADITDTEGK